MVASYNECPPEIQKHFEHFPALAKEFPWDVSLGYLIGRVELSHNMAIYCGVVKLHRANAELTYRAVQNQHMTREGFKTFFAAIFGKPIDENISKTLEEAEAVRDKILHGKAASQADMRKAVIRIFDYACKMNQFVHGISRIKPFKTMRGFKGRARSHDKPTSRWLLKGMGFTLA
jgi:hypothetical protein